MNLADAIRQAATEANLSLVEVPARVAAPSTQSAQTPEPEVDSYAAEVCVKSTISHPDGQPVRFELVLSPEQMNALFKGVVEAERSVLTLREAAHHLRIPSRRLEEIAELGQIPAFLIDGKWRFSRNSVDEWLAKQSFRKEMEA